MSGIFITQIGVSAPTAADYQFVFNSNWPSLQCAFDTLVTINASASLTVPHNLGFYPLTIPWVIQNGVSMGRVFAASGDFEAARGLTNYPQTAVSVSWDKTNIYLVNSDSSNSYTLDIKCYNIDISKKADYTLPKFPTFSTPYDNSVGIKLVKFNKGITSSDLRDFILHSRAQSPALLSIVTGNSTNGPIAYTNPAVYVPWTFGFYTDANGRYNGLAPGTQQSGALFKLGKSVTTTVNGVTATGSAVMASTINNVSMSLVVLRDPLVVANTVQAQYNTGSL